MGTVPAPRPILRRGPAFPKRALVAGRGRARALLAVDGPAAPLHGRDRVQGPRPTGQRNKIGLPTTASLDAFERAWTGANIDVYFRNSLIVTLGAVTLSVICATLAGYSFSKIRWRLRAPSTYFVLCWIAIPPLLLMVPIYVEMVQLGLLDTYGSVILLYTALNLPFNVYLMTAFFRSVPDELIEAARIDGAGVHRTFRVLLPLAKPALATLVIFNVLWAWNEFLFALLLLQSDSVKTLTVGVLLAAGTVHDRLPGPHGRPAHHLVAGRRGLPRLPAPSRPRHRRGRRQVDREEAS